MVIEKYIIYVIVYLINMVILIMRTVAVLHRVCRLLNTVRDSHKTCGAAHPADLRPAETHFPTSEVDCTEIGEML